MWSDNETEVDLLGFEHLKAAILSIVHDESLLPATIGVYGDWGSGKSSLMRMVREDLEREKDVVVLSFNGWLAAIIDALAPEGADLEQAATRGAIEQTLASLFEQYVTPDGSAAALEAMTPGAIRMAIEASVAGSIFNRWLGDLERMLEKRAVSAAQAVRLERDMESYIRDTVKLDLTDIDPLKMNWGGAEGSAFVERIYQEAYSIIGGRR